MLAFDLEGEVLLELALAAGLIDIGTHGGRQCVPQGPQDSILVGARHLLERRADATIEPRESALPRRRRAFRVEAGHEQVRQSLGYCRIVHQDLCDIALAERQSGLQQISAIGAHDDHEAPRYAGSQSQMIETVAIHAAGPNGREGTLDFALQCFELGHGRRLHHELQVLNPGAPRGRKLQFVGPLGDHLESHVLQHGQEVGNRNGILLAEDLQKEPVLAPRLGSVDIQMQARRLFLDGLEERHVEGGGVAAKVLGVGRGECLCIVLEQLQGVGFVEARQQRCLEAVGPRPHRGGDAQFQGVRVDMDFIAGSGPCDDVNAGEVRLCDLHLRLHAVRGKCLADDFFDALTDLCVVFFARYEHQAGIESVKRIAPEQHANPRTLL